MIYDLRFLIYMSSAVSGFDFSIVVNDTRGRTQSCSEEKSLQFEKSKKHISY